MAALEELANLWSNVVLGNGLDWVGKTSWDVKSRDTMVVWLTIEHPKILASLSNVDRRTGKTRAGALCEEENIM